MAWRDARDADPAGGRVHAALTRPAWCSTTSTTWTLIAEERPERPIPSGRISLAAARRLGWSLLIVGAAIPWAVSLAGRTNFALALIALLWPGTIVLYDRGLKRTTSGRC